MPKKPFQGGSNISTSFFTRNVPRGNLCLALITVRRSDVEHSLILDDNVFPLLAAWITSHQKRLESEPWLNIKLSHDMGWAWDTRPLVELLAVTRLLALVHPDKKPKDEIEVQSILSTLVDLLLLGRQHWVHWRRLLTTLTEEKGS